MGEENTGANGNENDANGNSNNSGNSGNGFVLDDATIDRIAEASQRKAAEWHKQSQGSNDAGSNENSDAGNSNSNAGNNDLLTAIQALPETVARAVQEAIVPPKSGNDNSNAGGNDGGNGANGNDGNGAGGNEGNQPGKHKSFAHWWFGVK